MITVYGASKMFRADLWKRLREEWPEIIFVNRWAWKHAGKTPDTPENAVVFWPENLHDVSTAKVVLVYAEPEDRLHGALVEAGMGIALGKTVIVVGQNPGYGTWQYHPQVVRLDSLEDARQWIVNAL